VATAGSSQIARKALAHALNGRHKTATLDFMAVKRALATYERW